MIKPQKISDRKKMVKTSYAQWNNLRGKTQKKLHLFIKNGDVLFRQIHVYLLWPRFIPI